MATWVDYKELKQRVKIADVLGHYGVLENLKRKGENLVGPCPIHKGTNVTQFHVSLAKNNKALLQSEWVICEPFRASGAYR